MTVNSTRADIAAAFDPAEVRSIRRDAAALERFYLAHYDDVVRYLTSRVADPHDVADLVADTFIAAVEAAESYDRRRGRVLPWLIGIAHNKLRRWYRQRGIVREVARRVVGRRLLDTDDIAELEERIDAQASGAFKALAGLSTNQREVVDLVDIQGFTPAETAKILGVSGGIARIRLHRARKALRAALGSDVPQRRKPQPEARPGSPEDEK